MTDFSVTRSDQGSKSFTIESTNTLFVALMHDSLSLREQSLSFDKISLQSYLFPRTRKAWLPASSEASVEDSACFVVLL